MRMGWWIVNKGFQVGWWLIAITVFIILGISFVGISWEGQYLPSVVLECIIIIPIMIGIWYAKRYEKSTKEILGIRKFSLKLLIPALLLTAGGQYFITYITMPIQSLLIIMFGAETATSQMVPPQSISEFIGAFITVCVVAPIVEELLCRGVLIKLFERYGTVVALVSSSLAFAMLHFEARSFIQLVFVGGLFGIFRLYTNSVLVTIIMHSFNNLLSLCQLMLLEGNNFSSLTIAIMLIALLFPFVFFFTFKKWRKYFDYVRTKSQKTGFSAGALICTIIFFSYSLILFLTRLINGDCLKDLYLLIGW